MSEGDAIKADKRRKKKMKEDIVDAIFGGEDSDDGGDYDPDAQEEPEYMEAEYQEGDEDRAERALAGTGD